MTAGLRALLSGVIDYAGLFPPAKLPLEEAVREYLAIRESPEAWMLGRFVVPAGRVGELEAWVDGLRRVRPLRLSLLGRPAADFADWHANLAEDLYVVSEFSHGRFLDDDCVMELAVPHDLSAGDSLETAIRELSEAAKREFGEVGLMMTAVYFEVPNSPAADRIRATLVRELEWGIPTHGFKLRTGGLTPDAFPSIEQLSSIVRLCHEHQCRWKATAGLHHPLRHHDPGIGVMMHGFLNVLFAAVLADAHDLPEAALREVLADEDAADFTVSDEGLRWRDYAASIEQIEFTRQTTFQSFGSCSFDEPREDLTTLGLL